MFVPLWVYPVNHTCTPSRADAAWHPRKDLKALAPWLRVSDLDTGPDGADRLNGHRSAGAAGPVAVAAQVKMPASVPGSVTLRQGARVRWGAAGSLEGCQEV